MKKIEVTYEKVIDMIANVMGTQDFLVKLIDMEQEISTIVTEKNHDYGDAWQRYGVFTPLIRINDKLLRVQTLVGGEDALVADEKIEDTLKDIIGYAALCLMWMKENATDKKHVLTFPNPFIHINNYFSMENIEIPPYSDKEVVDDAIDALITDIEENDDEEMTGQSFQDCCGDDKLVQ